MLWPVVGGQWQKKLVNLEVFPIHIELERS
jgi:hypothetical protein